MKPQKKLTEIEFTSMVLKLAKLHGWRTMHQLPGMNRRGAWTTATQGDGVGWPDIVFLRDDKLIVAELKVGKNKVTPAQDEWLDAFAMAGIDTFTWTPEDWPEIETVLRDGP